jgi:hypothetical protein
MGWLLNLIVIPKLGSCSMAADKFEIYDVLLAPPY